MGFGDVRLAALLGFALGHVGWAEFGVGMYSGFLIFGVPGLVLALVKWDRKLLKTAYPFGPFMILGALLGLLVGPPIGDYLVNR
jgi:leader peptidase (prepilin peptidase)/N-methyltransferase